MNYECEIFMVLFCYIQERLRRFSALCYYTFKLSMESYGMYIWHLLLYVPIHIDSVYCSKSTIATLEH